MKKVFAIIMALLITGCGKTAEEAAPVPEGFFDEPVTGEITVYCYQYYSQQYLEKAERLFEETYPGTDVKIQMFSAMPEIKIGYDEDGNAFGYADQLDEDAQRNAINDYISRVNTEMMSGKGPDVIATDVMPFYKYAENKALLDMAPYMEADPAFNKADYRQSLLDAVRYKGGQYIFPIDFLFVYLAYDASLFTDDEINKLKASDAFTFEQLIDIAKDAYQRNGDTYMFGLTGNMQPSNMFSCALEMYYASFVDIPNKKARFDDGRFAALLTSIKEWTDAGYIKKSVADGELSSWTLSSEMSDEQKITMTGIDITERFFYKRMNSAYLLEYFDANFDRWVWQAGMGNTDNDVVAGMFADYNGNVNISYGQAYAINENSANKRAAWEFIKILAGEQMQCELELWLPPINIKAFEKVAKWELTGSDAMYTRNPDENEIPEGKQEAYDNYLACIDRLSNLINACAVHDATIDQMINEEVTYFFDGTKSAEDVAKVLQNKANLYLSE